MKHQQTGGLRCCDLLTFCLANPTPNLVAVLPAGARRGARPRDFVGRALSLQSAAEGDLDLLRLNLGVGWGHPVLCSLRVSDYVHFADDAGQAALLS